MSLLNDELLFTESHHIFYDSGKGSLLDVKSRVHKKVKLTTL